MTHAQMTTEELRALVTRLLDWGEHDEGKINDARQEAADAIEALIIQNADERANGDRLAEAMLACPRDPFTSARELQRLALAAHNELRGQK